jgi:hypothetical protein
VRYSFDFLSLDGVPQIKEFDKVQKLLRKLPEVIVKDLKVQLNDGTFMITPFYLEDKRPTTEISSAYLGFLGFSLILPMVLFTIFRVDTTKVNRLLSLAALLYVLVESFRGPYNMWEGRYFISSAMLACPVIGQCINTKNKLFKIYLFAVIFIGCTTALSAALLRESSSIYSTKFNNTYEKSVYAMDRIGQLTRIQTQFYLPMRRFEEIVPENAVVAIDLNNVPLTSCYMFEYPLFGSKMRRKIIHVRSFLKGPLPIPKEAQYLLFTPWFHTVRSTDTFLGELFYLRKL